MTSTRFTVIDLTDLALCVPEVGAVNFNILHTVLTGLIRELGLEDLRIPCHIPDETLARTAITKSRLEQKHLRRPSRVLTIEEIRERRRAMDEKDETMKAKAQESLQKIVQGATIPSEPEEFDKTLEETERVEVQVSDIATEEYVKTPKDDDVESSTDKKVSFEKDKEVFTEDDMTTGLDDKGYLEDITVADDKAEFLEHEQEDLEEDKKEFSEEDEKRLSLEEKETLKDKESASEEKEISESNESFSEGKKDSETEYTSGEETESSEEDEEEYLEELKKSFIAELKEPGERRDSSYEIIDTATVEELQEKVRDIMEQSADVFAEQAAVVTDALKVLADEDLLDADPAKVMEEMWRATNVNRRMDAAEVGLRELSAIVDIMLDKVQDVEEESADFMDRAKVIFDEISQFLEKMKQIENTCKTMELKIEDCNDQRTIEDKRLEEKIKDLIENIDSLVLRQEELSSALKDLETSQKNLLANVVTKEDIEEINARFADLMEEKLREIKKLLREVEDSLVKKDDFVELMTRVDKLEDSKVSRDELGRLMEPGFIDSFLGEQATIKNDLNSLRDSLSALEDDLVALKMRIEEEILRSMEENFGNIYDTLKRMDAKLATLDADEINESFEKLEERADMIVKELEGMKAAAETFQKEAKINFNKIANFGALIERLEQAKVDKSKLYDLLATKADLDMIANKVDRSEFVAVITKMEDGLERLTITVKINEEEMQQNFSDVRQELALKMFTEDFITATEPIRNRIKTMIYELKRVKQIALTHLFPDAPGITRCISCKRGANMAGPKYLGDFSMDEDEETESFSKFPPIDLDNVPIPEPDKPRLTDPLQLPVLFAKARPQVGFKHGKRKKDIDNRLSSYFATKAIRRCDGAHTLTRPHQRGVKFTPVLLAQKEKGSVTLQGADKGIYMSTLNGVRYSEEKSPLADEMAKSRGSSRKKEIPTTIVSFHLEDKPIPIVPHLKRKKQ